MGSLMENRRRILLNTPHIESASGSVAHFSTDMASKLKECRVNFLPQQAGSGDPSPSNVRAISGWTGVTVERCGKNVGHVIGYSASGMISPTANKYISNNYGTTLSTTDFSLPDTAVTITQTQSSEPNITSYKNGYMVVVFDNLQFGKYYNVSFRVTDITSNPRNAPLNDIRLFPPSGSAIEPVINGDRLKFRIPLTQLTGAPNRMHFEIRNCGMSFTLSEFMITPEADTDYTWEPYNGNQITVSWDNLGTIYGGFIDVLRGELVQEWKCVDLGDYTYNLDKVLTGVDRFEHTFDDYARGSMYNFMCPIFKTENINRANENFSTWCVCVLSSNTPRFYFYTPSGTYADKTDFKTAMTGTKFVYKLATPITYPLSPEIIKAIKGVNNIWSDANGDVEVRYYTH